MLLALYTGLLRLVSGPAALALRVLLHAASLGEVQGVRELVDGLIARFGSGGVWITIMTTNGEQTVARNGQGTLHHNCVLFDTPAAWTVSCARYSRRPA